MNESALRAPRQVIVGVGEQKPLKFAFLLEKWSVLAARNR